AALAIHVGHGQHRSGRRRLMYGGGVGQELLRQPVAVHLVSPGLKAEIGIMDVVGGYDLRRVDGESCRRTREHLADAITLDRLDLILGLTRTIVIAGADAEERLIIEPLRRPRERQTRPTV